jgi:hypothetical protein
MGATTIRMRIESRLRRPVRRLGLAIAVVAVATAPAFLFFDPIDVIPNRGHVPREPLVIYTLFSDDVAYVSASRTLPRAFSNLFVPHNTHIVPAWRVLTWALVTAAGSFERLPEVLAVASYSILVAVMLLVGRLAARESGQAMLGLVAMVLVGTTSLMLAPAAWYSAGQPLWAGFGVLATLWYAQSYRRKGQTAALALACASAPLAGWFWTIGHLAGPVAAVYLWVDGRRRCRLAASAPLAASVLAVALSLAIGGRNIDGTVSFHGRSARNAVSPISGLLHTGQAIPENLVFGNLGLTVHTTPAQGALLSLGLIVFWSSRWWLYRFLPRRDDLSAHPSRAASGRPRAPGPLECAGLALVLGSYGIEWAFRGYMEYQYLRTVSLRFVVPWYDAIPQIGAVLFGVGWWAATRPEGAVSVGTAGKSLTLAGILAVATLALLLIALNRPRVDAAVRNSVPPLLASERVSKLFVLPRHQTLRANLILLGRAQWQRAHLRRLDRCEEAARRLGLGRETIRAAFVHPWIPATFVALSPTQYDLYDAVAMLDLPERGRPADRATVRGALAEFLAEDAEPRPFWLAPKEQWPPAIEPPAAD